MARARKSASPSPPRPARAVAEGTRREPPPHRRRIYAAVMLALPWLFLLLLEGGLRLAGYGSSYPLFISPEPQPEYLIPNPEVGRRYFRGSFLPRPLLDFFRAERRPETFRVFFQGGSSAAGFPYQHGGAPSRMLEQRLQETFPDREIEVVNTALTAVNSHTLLDQAGEIIEQRPDAVLIYAGHNEYYGVFGAGSSQSPLRSPWLVRAYLALSRLRTAQLVSSLLPTPRQEGGVAPRTAMEMMAGDRRIPLGSDGYQAGLEQFRSNLAALLERYRHANVPVLIGTVASNERDQAPFVSGLAPGTDRDQWERSYGAGVEAMRRGDAAAAEAALLRTLAMDSTSADAHFALAKLLDARGDHARARPHFRAAKEHDQLRFRAPEAINQIIREEAARHGATVVETQRALERAAPAGIIGSTLMLEHLHPNIDGYFVIADAFYDALRQKEMVGAWTAPVPDDRARLAVPVTRVDSLVGLLRTDRLRSGWPFQPAGTTRTPAVDTLRPRSLQDRLAKELVLERVPWPEAMQRLQTEHLAGGDPEEALRAARALALEYDPEPEPHMQAGQIALALGRVDEALRHVQAANRRQETVERTQLLGLLLLRRGDHADAVRQLRRATQLSPLDERARVTLLAAEAIPELERERTRSPRDPGVLYNLATAYALTRQFEKAKDVAALLLQVDPGHAQGRELLRGLPE